MMTSTELIALVLYWLDDGQQSFNSSIPVCSPGFKTAVFFIPHEPPHEPLAQQKSPLLWQSSPVPCTSVLFFYIFILNLSPSLPHPLVFPPSPHDSASNTGRHVSRAGSIQAHLLHVLYNESYITCLLTAVAACNLSCLEHKYNYKQRVPFTNSRGWSRIFSSTPYGDINQAVIWSVIAAAINTLHRLVMLLCLHALGHVSYS